jgi:hypothetical protein
MGGSRATLQRTMDQSPEHFAASGQCGQNNWARHGMKIVPATVRQTGGGCLSMGVSVEWRLHAIDVDMVYLVQT